LKDNGMKAGLSMTVSDRGGKMETLAAVGSSAAAALQEG
jgi:hypothetical protein